MKAIRISGLNKSFGSAGVVNDLSFVVEESSLTTLLGPSGCGKTTVLRCVAGLETPSSGEIEIGDVKVFSSATNLSIPADCRGVGMVFQNYALWPHLTVFENIAFGLTIRGWAKKEIRRRVDEMLELIGLPNRAESYPGELSGGQQQRVALARALTYSPDVLLLDEPLANLDATMRESMRYELREIQRKTGVTALYVTHDQAEAMVLSDRVIVMRNGRIEQEGPPAEVYQLPRTSFVANFIGISNVIEVRTARIEAGWMVGESPLGPLRFAGRAGEIDGPLALAIRPEDIILAGLSTPAVEGTNLFETVLHSQTYLGEMSALFLDGPGGQRLRAHVGRSFSGAPGMPVRILLPPERLVHLERS